MSWSNLILSLVVWAVFARAMRRTDGPPMPWPVLLVFLAIFVAGFQFVEVLIPSGGF